MLIFIFDKIPDYGSEKNLNIMDNYFKSYYSQLITNVSSFFRKLPLSKPE